MEEQPRRRSRFDRAVRFGAWFLAIYLLLAYVAAPRFWKHHDRLDVGDALPKYTRTTDGIQGDPLNVALVGSEDEVRRAFAAIGWSPAAALSLRADIDIAESVLLDRPDADAPVSTLLLWDRKEDLAFEREAGKSAKQRNHVRFWKAPMTQEGRTLWVGAASFDHRVELSRRTGQITHRIAPDLDAERDGLMDALDDAHQLTRLFAVTGIGPTLRGRNGGGDPYYTDGELWIGALASAAEAGRASAERLPSPRLVTLKDGFWAWVAKPAARAVTGAPD